MKHWQSASWAPSDRIDEEGFAHPARPTALSGEEPHICPCLTDCNWGAWGAVVEVDPNDGRPSVRRVIVRVAIDRA